MSVSRLFVHGLWWAVLMVVAHKVVSVFFVVRPLDALVSSCSRALGSLSQAFINNSVIAISSVFLGTVVQSGHEFGGNCFVVGIHS